MKSQNYDNLKEAEAIVLYSVIVSNENMDEVYNALEDKHFRQDAHRYCFSLSRALWVKKQLNMTTFLSELRKENKTDYLKDIIEVEQKFYFNRSKENVMASVNYIKEEYVKTSIAYNLENLTSAEIADMVKQNVRTDSVVVGRDQVEQIIREIISKDVETVPFPSIKLNKIMHGIKKGEYTIIAARPSVGKSLLLEQIFWNATKEKKKMLFVSLEMSEDMIFKRHIQRMTGVNLFNSEIGLREKANMLEKIKSEIGDSKIVFNGSLSVNDIEAIVKQEEPDAVLIDYLQLVSVGPRFQKEYDKVTEITKQLSSLRKKYPIALIVASQLNRTNRVQPRLIDLRSSGQIEQDADLVISLYKKMDDEDVAGSKRIYIDCLKNRNGMTFSNDDSHEFVLTFQPERMRIVDTTDYNF